MSRKVKIEQLGLGRRFAPDPRDQQYLMRSVLPPTAAPELPRRKHWALNWKGDQGAEPQCVGYAWHGLLRAKPLLQRDPVAPRIYFEAQKRDEWEGEDYEGSSVRGGAKYLKEVGKIKEYRWAFQLDDVVQWVATVGPVVFGTNWYEGMFTPDKQGIISPTGQVVGGHAYICIGYSKPDELLHFQNSWGRHWGVRGRFYMRFADADRLIKEDGEACTPVEL